MSGSAVESLRSSQIAENAGVDGGVVAQKIKEKLDDVNFGYNAMTHKYGDLIADGVIVPTKVERNALENAASIGSLLLTTEAVVSEIKEDKPEMAGGGAGWAAACRAWAAWAAWGSERTLNRSRFEYVSRPAQAGRLLC